MISFLLAAALPGLFVDGAPDTTLKQAGFDCVAVPQARTAEWKGQGQCAEGVDPGTLIKLPSPGVRYRMNVATATSAPWVDNNGWQYLRGLKGKGLVTAGEGRAALAAAEAHAFGVDVLILAPKKDWKDFAEMRKFLSTIPDGPPGLANFGFIDDGSAAAGENMNLFLRRNLLFRVVDAPQNDLAFTVKPKPGDPSEYAYEIRNKLTDEKRLMRLFGSEVTIAKLGGDKSRRRVSLLNYGGRPVEGLRIRVLGKWPKLKVYSPGGTVKVLDIVTDATGTEFSVDQLPLYAVIDMQP